MKIQNRAHRVCAVCGCKCYHICTLCKDGIPLLHKPPTTKDEKTCFYQWHNTLFYGHAKGDAKLVDTKRKDYAYPTDEDIASHGEAIKCLREQQTVLQSTSRVDNDENVAANNGGTSNNTKSGAYLQNGVEHFQL